MLSVIISKFSFLQNPFWQMMGVSKASSHGMKLIWQNHVYLAASIFQH